MGEVGKTSIHIEPVKAGSEAHNLREKELDYVNKELTRLNEKVSYDTIANRLEQIKAKYTATTGQKMQNKATPIREGVIVVNDRIDILELQSLAFMIEERFGIRAFQIHLHADEGHRDLTTQEWKPNLHAHMVFDWTDKETGKSIKLNRQDMAEMQTLCASALHMDRGVSSDVKHLNAVQFKVAETEKNLNRLRVEEATIKPKENISKAVSKAAEKLTGLLGVTKNDKEKDALKSEIIALKEEIQTLGRKNEFENHILQTTIRELDKEKSWHKSLREKFESAKIEIQRLKNLYEPNINQNKNKQQRLEM